MQRSNTRVCESLSVGAHCLYDLSNGLDHLYCVTSDGDRSATRILRTLLAFRPREFAELLQKITISRNEDGRKLTLPPFGSPRATRMAYERIPSAIAPTPNTKLPTPHDLKTSARIGSPIRLWLQKARVRVPSVTLL